MPERKHTPGPWVVDESRHDGSINRLEPFRHIGMCSQYQFNPGSRAENEANAKLMAAAPDLLTALEAAVAFITSHAADPDLTSEMCDRYAEYLASEPEAAIRKATA